MPTKYGDFHFDSLQGFTGSAGKKFVRAYQRGGSVKKDRLPDEVRDIQYSEYAHTTKVPVKKSKDKVMAKGGKVQKVMHEFKTGQLHSGSKKGPVVKSRKQAIAIALSEARKAKK